MLLHRVLVVDDDSASARLLALALAEHLDHTVVEEETDPVAVLHRLIAGERFDTLVCDIVMPEMTGVELHEALSRFAPEQADRMIFVSGGLSAPAAGYLRGLANPLLCKPVAMEPLLAAVRRVQDG